MNKKCIVEQNEKIKCIFDDKAEGLEKIIEKVFLMYIDNENAMYITSKRDWLKFINIIKIYL